SIGELEGRINRLKAEYEKRRGEINDLIDEHNRLVSLLEHTQEFYTLSKKGELSDTEQLRRAVCKQAMERNGILNTADVDTLRRNVESLVKRIGGMKESLEKCRQQYEVYCDIRDTYNMISKGDYLSNLVEEERKHRGQVKKKTKSR
ncbi:MAG: relaxase, partial [Ruminococcus sp.]|nr:relaxase [Ruminococcus sp.]